MFLYILIYFFRCLVDIGYLGFTIDIFFISLVLLDVFLVKCRVIFESSVKISFLFGLIWYWWITIITLRVGDVPTVMFVKKIKRIILLVDSKIGISYYR